MLQTPVMEVLPCPCQTASWQNRCVKQAGTGTRDRYWRDPPDTTAIYVSLRPLVDCSADFLPGTLLLVALWRAEQPQLPSAAAVRHLPVVSKLTPSQTCPVRSPAVWFLPKCLHILSETHSRFLGFRQKTADACFQA